MTDYWAGLFLVAAAGVMGGSFTVPQKFVRGWSWEKTWLLYSVVGMVLVPWLLVALYVPRPLEVYAAVPSGALVMTALFGAGWGVGSVLFGLSVARVGTALAFAIVVSLTAALGALVPLAVLHPDQLTSNRAIWLLLGLGVVVVGLILCARAGALKEAATGAESAGGKDRASGRFSQGLILCLLSGVTSPMFNFSLAFGQAVTGEAEKRGASPVGASTAALAVALSAGFVVNAGYCLFLLWRGRGRPAEGAAAGGCNTVLALLMGLLWMFGMFAYVAATARLGDMGPVLGWPLFMTVMVLAGNFWGAVTGEWRKVGPYAFALLQLGNAAMVLAFVIISFGARSA